VPRYASEPQNHPAGAIQDTNDLLGEVLHDTPRCGKKVSVIGLQEPPPQAGKAGFFEEGGKLGKRREHGHDINSKGSRPLREPVYDGFRIVVIRTEAPVQLERKGSAESNEKGTETRGSELLEQREKTVWGEREHLGIDIYTRGIGRGAAFHSNIISKA